MPILVSEEWFSVISAYRSAQLAFRESRPKQLLLFSFDRHVKNIWV